MKLKPIMPACCFLIISIAPGFAQKESVQNNEAAIAWNLIAVETANEHDQFFPFSMESLTALPNAKIRSYDNLDLAAEDCGNSRVMNGFHFRFAVEAGKVLGRQVARHLFSNYLRPIEASSK